MLNLIDIKTKMLSFPRLWLSGKYNWNCEPVDYSYSPTALDAADMTWWYHFSKWVDYLDSFFFILRKKYGHLSTLHVVHHGIMPGILIPSSPITRHLSNISLS